MSKKLWQSLSPSSIKTLFAKEKLFALEVNREVVNEMEYSMTKVAQAFTILNISLGQEKLKEFVHFEDEYSEVFVAAILEDVVELLESMKMVENNLDDDTDIDIFICQESYSGLENIVVFRLSSHFVSKLLIYSISC